MNLTIIIQPEAEADLETVQQWYEGRRLGLGREFLEEINRALARIAENPLRLRTYHRGTRRARLWRFPYVILYLPRDKHVFVLAVLHERSSPRRFKTRARTA